MTVEGQSNGETNLSFGAANGSGELRLFDEHGTAYNVTSTIGATVAVKSGNRSQPDSTEVEPSQNHFQVDPDAGDTYHKQDRFIMALHIKEDESQRGAPGSPMSRTYHSKAVR